VFIEITNTHGNFLIIGVIYRPNSGPHADLDIFSRTIIVTMQDIMDNIQHKNKPCVFMGDMNINLLKCGDHSKTNEYLDTVISHGYLPVITKPTRICSSSATLIDHIYINKWHIIHTSLSLWYHYDYHLRRRSFWNVSHYSQWKSILKQAIGKLSNKSSFPSEFLINNIPVSDKKELVESFNIFFTNIFTRTRHNVPQSNKCFSLFMNLPLRNSSFIQYVAPDAIIDIFNKIKPKSSFEKMKYRQS
jgi:hypothetical protein